MSNQQLNFGIKISTEGGTASAAEAEKVKGAFTSIGTAAEQANQKVAQSSRQAIDRLAEMAGVSSGTADVLRSLPIGYGFVAAAIGTLAKAAVDGAAEIKAMNLAIGKGGDISGQSAASLRALSADLASHSQLTIAQSRNVAIALAESGQIGAAAFDKITRLAGDYARVMGTDVAKIGPELVKVFADPVRGAEMLNQQLHFLSAAELDRIEHLARTGNLSAAQVELEEKLSAALDRIKPKLTALGQAWDSVKGASSKAWDTMMGLGREESITDRLEALYKRIRDVQAMGAGARNLPTDKQAPALMQEAMRLEEQRDAESGGRAVAAAAAEKNRNDMTVKGLRDQLVLKYKVKEIDDQIALARKSGGSVADTDLLVAALEAKKAELLKPKNVKADRSFSDAAVVQAEQYADLYKQGIRYVDGVNQQFEAGRKLSEGEKILATAKAHLTAAQYGEIEALVSGSAARDKWLQQEEEARKQ